MICQSGYVFQAAMSLISSTKLSTSAMIVINQGLFDMALDSVTAINS